jgi:hypothetical protein
MSHLRYFVLDDQGSWKIGFNGQLYGDFRSEQEALSKAIESAFSDSMSGHKADILIRDKGTDHFKVAWSYGRS